MTFFSIDFIAGLFYIIIACYLFFRFYRNKHKIDLIFGIVLIIIASIQFYRIFIT